MKKLLSWLLLILSHFILALYLSATDALYLTLRYYDDTFSFPLRQLIKFVNWGIVTPLIWMPILVYATLTTSLCDKVSYSKKGTRYLIFGILMLSLYLLSFITNLFKGEFHHLQLITALSHLMLILHCKSERE